MNGMTTLMAMHNNSKSNCKASLEPMKAAPQQAVLALPPQQVPPAEPVTPPQQAVHPPQEQGPEPAQLPPQVVAQNKPVATGSVPQKQPEE